MKKMVSVIMGLILIASLTACAGKKEASESAKNRKEAETESAAEAGESWKKESGRDTALDAPEADNAFSEPASEPASDGAEEAAAAEPDKAAKSEPAEEAESDAFVPEPGYDVQHVLGENDQSRAGLLTAGEWNDNLNWDYLLELAENQRVFFPLYGLNPMNRIQVHVSNHGDRVKDARVILYDRDGSVIWRAVSDYSGTAYVFYDVFAGQQRPEKLEIIKSGNKTVLSVAPDGQSRNQSIREEVDAELKCGGDTGNLDVMFFFDTTGSMGDELSYLQTEFDDIARRTGDQNTSFSVNFYRDRGDEYLVKPNDFTRSTRTVIAELEKEYAAGGGDYEEAVEEALHNAVFEHQWREESTKLLFLILDAPPHDNSRVWRALAESIPEAAEMGIRIIPIASSGVDKDTEFLLRSWAILTGGTYTFLTDDSGVGEAHLEPTIGRYQVENLNDCIVRLIHQYHSGLTVGQ